MKFALISLFCIVMMACKEAPKAVKPESEVSKIVTKIDDSRYPEAIQKIFEAHGGLKEWKNKRVLSFEIPKKDVIEVQTIDLKTRDEKIEIGAISMGSEGTEYWLLDENGNYSGDPLFYHNLMFYFYAMPFVISDNGINYSETPALEFDGTSYPGVRISFNDGVGLSSKDEYFVHYNSETFQMEWLGYTVTYRSGEKSEKIKWIRYNDWMKVNKVILPKSLTWYTVTDGKIIAPSSTRNFENVILTEVPAIDDFFSKPVNAKTVNQKGEYF